MKHKGLLIAGVSLAALVALVAVGFWATQHVVISVQLRSDVGVSVDEPVTLQATVDGPIDVDIDATVTANATVKPLAVSVDQVVRIPLHMTLEVPLDAKVMVDEVIRVRTTVPVDMVLTEKELDLSRLEIPIDDSVYVDDVILVDTIVPIDSTATTTLGIEVPVKMNVPIKLKVPVRQKVRVRDTLKLGLKSFRIPFHVDLPVNADVPFKQELTVSGKARVPVRQVVAVPLKETLQVTVPGSVPVEATVKGKATGRIGSPVRVTADLGEGIRAKVGEIRVDASEVDVQKKPSP
jgi:hypothetical protein